MKTLFVFILVICILGLVTGNRYSGEKYYDRDLNLEYKGKTEKNKVEECYGEKQTVQTNLERHMKQTDNNAKIHSRVVRQVAKWLIQAMQNSDLPLCNLSPHKRNSEIITSILGLPKNLNDAGRK